MMRRAFTLPLLTAAAVLTLSGCGFSPIYANSGPVASSLAGVEVQSGEGRDSYLVNLALRDRLGAWQGDRALYTLQTYERPRRTSSALTVDQAAARIALTMDVDYALYERESGRRLTTGAVRGQATYDVPDDPYAALRAESEASERAASDAADRLVAALAAHFRDGANR